MGAVGQLRYCRERIQEKGRATGENLGAAVSHSRGHGHDLFN